MNKFEKKRCKSLTIQSENESSLWGQKPYGQLHTDILSESFLT